MARAARRSSRRWSRRPARPARAAVTSPAAGSWSPRARPTSRSTPFGSSATARAGRWASPSPREALARGARSTLVLGPGTVRSARGRRASSQVETAEQMRARRPRSRRTRRRRRHGRRRRRLPPEGAADRKLKKEDGPPELALEPTPDILRELGAAPGRAGARRVRRRDRRRRGGRAREARSEGPRPARRERGRARRDRLRRPRRTTRRSSGADGEDEPLRDLDQGRACDARSATGSRRAILRGGPDARRCAPVYSARS